MRAIIRNDFLQDTAMTVNQQSTQQVMLEESQIAAFYVDCFAVNQVNHFERLTDFRSLGSIKLVVDIGGGCGYFAKELNAKTGLRVRVIDSDERSIEACARHNIKSIEGVIGDALNPEVKGDEDVVCFNLLLHHLIAKNEHETRELQKKAIVAWRDKVRYVFVNEYIYDSFFGYASGRIIFEITKSKLLSAIGRLVSEVVPSFKANTFGVGVRFRAHAEWIELFEECGYEVVSKAYSEPDYTSLPLRALLIREVRKDSFLLKRRHN
jgi:SAM-dependent methyltransferase